MSKMSSLGTAVSGLHAAQTGLYVTGHNLSNVDSPGYTRQQALQNDFASLNIGRSGTSMLQLGLGTDITCIRQFRNSFLDLTYRSAVSKVNFYTAKYEAGMEVQTILGEMEGEYKFQVVLDNLWNSINELSNDQTSIGVRGAFIETATTFITKVNNIADRFSEYQSNMNEQIKKCVYDINRNITIISQMNDKIALAEASGDHANDYRDTRNNALDELAKLIDITYRERLDGTVDVMSEGQELIMGDYTAKLGLRYSAANCNFVEPVFTDSLEILPYDPLNERAKPLFNYKQVINSNNDNDNGVLKGLIIARGLRPADYTSSDLKAPIPAGLQPPAYARWDLNGAELEGLDPDFIADYKQYLIDYADYEQNLNAYLSRDFMKINPGVGGEAPKAPKPPDVSNYFNHEDQDQADAAELSLTLFIARNPYDDPTTGYNDQYSAYLASYNTIATDTNVPKLYKGDRDYRIAYAEYERDIFNMNNCFMPKVQNQIDLLVNSIVNLLNDTIAPYIEKSGELIKNPDAPYGLDKVSQYQPIFVRIANGYQDRFDENGYLVGENPDEKSSLYSMGNIMINPLFRSVDNYDLLAFSYSGDNSDNRLLNDLVETWKAGFIQISGSAQTPQSVDSYYRELLVGIGSEINEADTFLKSQIDMVREADLKRMQMSSVSMDEEMKNMLTYQHAYNASARIFNVIDGMIDRIVNGTGRVGL